MRPGAPVRGAHAARAVDSRRSIDFKASAFTGFGKLENVALFCRADRPEQLLCTVSMSGNLEAAAHAIAPALVRGGELCAFVPVPLSFKCARRLDGQVLRPMCSDCRWSGVQCRAQLD